MKKYGLLLGAILLAGCGVLGDINLIDANADGSLVAYRVGGVNYGVCDDSFGEDEAIVVCRTVGLTYVSHMESQAGPTDIHYIDDLDCRGTESDIESCSYIGNDSENCSANEWIRIVCE